MFGSYQYESFQLKRKSLPTTNKVRPILITTKRRTIVSGLSIIDGNKDVTPKPLDPEIYNAGKERQISVYDISVISGEKYVERGSIISGPGALRTQSTVRFRPDTADKYMPTEGGMPKTSASLSYDFSYLSPLETMEGEKTLSSPSSSEVDHEEIFETEITESEIFSNIQYPEHVSLILRETDTCFLLDIPSVTAEKDTDEGNMVEAENEIYEFLTVGKGRYRKTLNAEAQTVPITMKTRSTYQARPRTQVGAAFVSNWDMYDTYQAEQTHSSEDEKSEHSDDLDHRLATQSSLDSFRLSNDEKQMLKLIKNPRFLEAISVVERLLANNCYNEQQKIFRGLTVQDDFRENIEYNYKLNLLWTFANSSTKGKSVNSIHWNPANKDIVAVGYGKFHFADNIPGLVLIWNIKNPVQPERSYSFTDSVTTLSFSTKNPMLLAVGFYQGSVIVLNIVSREKMIIGENVPTFEPAWDISWQFGRNEKSDKELVVVAFDDGRICSYSVHRKMHPSHLMRVAKSDGRLKGYDVIRKCSNLTMPVTRYSGALFKRPHPVYSSFYFVATNEGVIHKCSLNYLNRHLDLFLAHDGPIHEMKFSPFSRKIFATCGDDWHTRIWAEGISEPLFELFVSMQSIEGLDWSPTHSTILVDIRGQFIEIWDLQRKVYAPQSVTNNPAGARNTAVQFTSSGRSLIVGDIDGNVHVFALEDMPFPAFFQENLLLDSLYRGLLTNPTLLEKLRKLKWKPTVQLNE